jgi:hypothetical protein
MIVQTGTALLSDLARSGQARLAMRVVVAVVEAPRARPAPRAQPRRLAEGLPGLLAEGDPIRDPSRVRAAALAFSCGDGFVPGQIIDRAI